MSISSSTQQSSPNAFTIQPLTEADIPATARICGLSMATDRHTMVKAGYKANPYNHEGGMHGAFEYFLSLPSSNTECVKAVDSNSGEILGVVVWHTRLEEMYKDEVKDEASDETKVDTTEEQREKPSNVVSSDYEPEPSKDLREQLDAMTSAHLADYQKGVTSRTPNWMVIGTLAVHPDAQGRGVGSALIRHGTDRADANGLLAWVHSSDGAQNVYARAGFVEDEILDLDLDDWAKRMEVDPPKELGDKWGGYRFRYMVRQPKSTRT